MDCQLPKELEELLDGTFVGDFMEAMIKAKSAQIMDPVMEDERVVGEMNSYENACNFLREKYNAEEERITVLLNEKSITPRALEEEAQLEVQLETCKSRFEMATTMVWESINTRLAARNIHGITRFDIRAGNRIVILFDKGRSTRRTPRGGCCMIIA